MQNLAAYLFEADIDDPNSRLDVLDHLIDSWLEKKGVQGPRTSDGYFVSKTGDGTGHFSRQMVKSSVGSLSQVELMESVDDGAMFTTRMQIATTGRRIVVYATLSATPAESRVAPIRVYPRCPLVIRSIIEKFGDWKFADQSVPLAQAFDATSSKNAKILCDILRSESRRLPVVVVSNDEDEAIWPDLQTKIAEHLVGLADTAFVSAESSWVLTDELEQRDSCYLGAVRLYWPGRRHDGSLAGINWIASKLASLGIDDGGRNRFLAALRREIMSVAALTMVPPVLFREIRTSAEKERLLALEEDARDYELTSIIEENARLSVEVEKVNSINQSLRWKLDHPGYHEVANDQNESASEFTHETIKKKTPTAGSTIYYKKIGSGGGVDTLVQTASCNHKESNWKPAFKGDQAEKGLHKLEGRNNWRSIAHCSACTGGGRWRVNW
ncbi:hypothetical protein AVME950_22305 [Acidovorax sp. SUPP950]|uniref:hypothetical protein n=1 Tax=Acidovorax sp. SUPP950 TaxID=511901 RepID=UPI0023C8A382|nr:hypothetical protein [Acidovorax sp. SUPP950]GKS77679.1 hypothetical protein AVME950_22305 [Acidovorax sp. SUPP950]